MESFYLRGLDKFDSSELLEDSKKPNNILLVSHNARMRCFLEDVIKDKMTKYKTHFNVQEIRFKNTAVLLLKLRKNNNMVNLSLAFEGEVNNPKKGAYFINNDTDIINNILFIKFENTDFNINELGISSINDDYNIFIARHGEGSHNIVKLNLNKDTSLTEEGQKQALSFNNYILRKNIKINHIFSSNLKRTRQTASYIKNENILTDKIIVLPCAHELSYSNNGKCDQYYKNVIIPFAPENRSTCSEKSNTECRLNDDCCLTSYGNLEIDWSYYEKFKSNNDCTKTNMIKLIINYFENNNQYGGHIFKNKHQKYKMKYLYFKKKLQY